MKIIKLITLSLLISAFSVAQGFEVPNKYSFKTDADYQKYESSIIECADWLISSPINIDVEKRKKATKFLIDYVTGSPLVSVELNGSITPFITNQDFMVIFIASWTKSCLSQNYVNNKKEFTVRATEHVITFYNANKKNIKESEELNKFIKLQKDGQLENYINKLIK